MPRRITSYAAELQHTRRMGDLMCDETLCSTERALRAYNATDKHLGAHHPLTVMCWDLLRAHQLQIIHDAAADMRAAGWPNTPSLGSTGHDQPGTKLRPRAPQAAAIAKNAECRGHRRS